MSEKEKVRIRVGVPPDSHPRLRVLAAESGMSMSAYCEALIADAIKHGRVLKPAKKEKN